MGKTPDPARYERIRALFHAALDVPENERDALVHELADGDEALAGEVLGLLARRPAELPVPELAPDLLTDLAPDQPLPESVGGFRILSQIGRGGMGVVYLAEQKSPPRRVALKVIRPGTATDRSLRRFEHEIELLGRLRHPGIAQIFAAGETEQGPFFAMELVDGAPLDAYLDGRSLDVPEALDLVLQACDAVAHAHQRGVLHRDLKPSNLLVDGEGRVKVVDFGVARSLEADSELSSMHTASGQLVGTLAYMSPESFSNGPDALDTRSDLYALGVIACECLTGEPPYDFAGRSLLDYGRVISEESPRLGQLDRDLQVVLGKALSKRKEDRYPSVHAFADDLRRILDGEPIAARPPSSVERMRRYVRRNPVTAGAVAAAVVLLLGGTGTSTHLYVEARENARVAEKNAVELEGFLAGMDARAMIERADDLWPPTPERIDAMEAWLDGARSLTALLDGEDGFRARRTELRARALPLTPAEQAAFDAHPEDLRVTALRAKVDAMRFAAEVRSGVREAPDPEGIDLERVRKQNATAEGLADSARGLVAPDRPKYGQEQDGLIFAKTVLAMEGDSPTPESWLILAWARRALGDDERARLALDQAASLEPSEEVAIELELLRQALAQREDPSLIAQLEEQLAHLMAATLPPRPWRFEAESDAERYQRLSAVLPDLEALADPAMGLIEGRHPVHGLGVMHRMELAHRVARDQSGSESAWQRAAELAADPDGPYRGLELPRAEDLLPLGADPDSGLLEFAHLPSGHPPRRDGSGRLSLDSDSAIVLVLIPGGTARHGVQAEDPSAPSFDPEALMSEGPVHEVELMPYFLAKHELSQAQYERMTGSNPSNLTQARQPSSIGSTLHPVESVSWEEAELALRRFGLALPTEVQWEHAARGGSEEPRWCGADKRALAEVENIADQALQTFDSSSPGEPWDDGQAVHAPIDGRPANPFGLHDMLGNVAEWCRDWQGPYQTKPARPGDGLRLTDPQGQRVARGGSFIGLAHEARAGRRASFDPGMRGLYLGIRAAREFEPSWDR